MSEPGLEVLKEIVLFKVGQELGGHSSFQHLGQEGEAGDGPVVGSVFWIQSGFFQLWSDDGGFQCGWDMAGLEGAIDDLSDEGAYGGEVGLQQGCGEGVQGTGRRLHRPNDGLNLSLSSGRETAERLGNLRLWVNSPGGQHMSMYLWTCVLSYCS